VFENNGNYYSLDNRRLFSYKSAGLDTVPVTRVDIADVSREISDKFHPLGDGSTIKIRGE
jgi:hypothetical protein